MVWGVVSTNAEMAELADAHGSGPCEVKLMRVQVPFSASIFQRIASDFVRCYFLPENTERAMLCNPSS